MRIIVSSVNVLLVQQYSDAPDKVEVVKVSVRMQFVCEMMHVSLGQELGERVKHTKRLHLRLTKAIYHPISAYVLQCRRSKH